MSFPIIFIHKRYSSYLEYSLRQASYTNQDTEIILLGDESNNRFPFVTHVNVNDYFVQASRFAEIYQHNSTNPYDYELFCFQRWFIINEFLKSSGYDEVFTCDSDVLLYSDINKVLENNYQGIDIGIMFCSQTTFSGGISFWKTRYLDNLCSLLESFYTTQEGLAKIKDHIDYTNSMNQLGGFSDMTAFTNFYNTHNRTVNIMNLIEIRNKSVFDGGINHPDIAGDGYYEFKFGKKVFKWDDNIPYSYNYKKECDIRFNCIHFQGPAKYLMAYFYTGKVFPGKRELDIKFKILNFAAFLYKTFKVRHRFAFIFNFLNRRK